jgi:hypothetical protein
MTVWPGGLFLCMMCPACRGNTCDILCCVAGTSTLPAGLLWFPPPRLFPSFPCPMPHPSHSAHATPTPCTPLSISPPHTHLSPSRPLKGEASVWTNARHRVRVPSCAGEALRDRPTNRYTAGNTCRGGGEQARGKETAAGFQEGPEGRQGKQGHGARASACVGMCGASWGRK